MEYQTKILNQLLNIKLFIDMLKYILSLTTIFIVLTSNAKAEIITETNYNGKHYYVDVIAKGSTAKVWFRLNRNQSSNGDIHTMTLKAEKSTLNKVGNLICRSKKIYDNGRTMAGCLSTAATAGCAMATVSSGGTLAAFCTASFTHTANRGLADCISGVSDKIADFLGMEKEWKFLQVSVGLEFNQWTDVIDRAIDIACENL